MTLKDPQTGKVKKPKKDFFPLEKAELSYLFSGSDNMEILKQRRYGTLREKVNRKVTSYGLYGSVRGINTPMKDHFSP